MKLLQFSMNRHRGLPPRELRLSEDDDAAAPVVAVTGGSGSGKTTLLESIARHKEHIAPYGRPTSVSDVIGASIGRVEMRSTWLLSEAERKETGSRQSQLAARSLFASSGVERSADPALAHVLARWSLSTGKVDLFPVERIAARRSPTAADPWQQQKQMRLSTTSDKYGSLGRLLIDAPEERRAELSALLEVLRPGFRVSPDPRTGVRFETASGTRTLTQLSTSERLAFELAATFVLVGLHHSVVMIDTPEMGWPSGRAAEVIGALREHAPTTQLVVATTDPGVLRLAEAKVIELETT